MLSGCSFRVFVRDLDVARRFYTEALGLTLRFAEPTAPVVMVGSDEGALVLELADDDPESDELVGRFTGITFNVADCKAASLALIERGVAFTSLPETQGWGGVMAHFVDPDNNTLTLLESP